MGRWQCTHVRLGRFCLLPLKSLIGIAFVHTVLISSRACGVSLRQTSQNEGDACKPLPTATYEMIVYSGWNCSNDQFSGILTQPDLSILFK